MRKMGIAREDRNRVNRIKSHRSILLKLIILGIMISCVVAGCSPQTKMLALGMGNALAIPKFGFQILSYPSMNSDSSEANLYARVRYDDLIFIRTDSAYTAHYQLSVNLYSDRSMTESRYLRLFDRKVIASNYSRTLSIKLFDFFRDSIIVKPGKYFIALRLLDLNTNVTSTKEIEYNFKNFFNGSVNISDVMLRVPSDANGFPAEFVRNNSNLFADFYVTAKVVPTSISLHMIVKSTEAPTLIDTTFKLDQTSDVQHYDLPVSIGELAPADYDFRISVGENSAEASFTVERSTSNASLMFLNRDPGALTYIMGKEQLDSLKNSSLEEREKILKDFWLARSKGDTSLAKAMRQEFYERFEAADEQYGTPMMAGWQSDRGRIYILYGKPERIENHSYNLTAGSGANSMPYEVWYYDKLHLKFVFVDEFRNGDYRLATTSRK